MTAIEHLSAGFNGSDLLRLSPLMGAPTSRSARPASDRAVVELAGEAAKVLLDQTTAVDPSRLGLVVAHLRHHEMAAVDADLRRALGLDDLEGPPG